MSADQKRAKAIVSIIGDRFMLPSMFEKAIREKCGEDLEIRSLEMPWPDEPMQHGYAEPGMEGLKEYQGDAEDVVAHMDGAEIAVTHLAPFSAGILARLPKLKLIAVSRGGPVNIDMAAARERQIRVVNTPGRNASAVAEFTIGAILAETRLITRGHDSLRQGRVARRSLSRRYGRRGAVRDDCRRHRLRPRRDQSGPLTEGLRLSHSRVRSLRSAFRAMICRTGSFRSRSTDCLARPMS